MLVQVCAHPPFKLEMPLPSKVVPDCRVHVGNVFMSVVSVDAIRARRHLRKPGASYCKDIDDNPL